MKGDEFLKEYFNFWHSTLCPGLASKDSLTNVLKLVQVLPTFHDAVFECRLGKNASRIDLSVAVSPSNIYFPEALLIHPTWNWLQSLCNRLKDRNSNIWGKISEIWLEFDNDASKISVFIPCILLGLNLSTRDFLSLQNIVLELPQLPSYPSIRSSLRLCSEALPASARIIYIGVMSSRSPKTLRLGIHGISPHEIPKYLNNIPTLSLSKDLEKLILELHPYIDYIDLSLDISHAVDSRFGLECFISKGKNYITNLNHFLQKLLEMSLCTVDQCQMLLEWSRKNKHLPDNLNQFITHFKIVYQLPNALEVKVYLGVSI